MILKTAQAEKNEAKVNVQLTLARKQKNVPNK